MRVGEAQLIFRSRFSPVAQATLWIGIYADDGTNLGGLNSQVAAARVVLPTPPFWATNA